jgi:hypothetical protein
MQKHPVESPPVGPIARYVRYGVLLGSVGLWTGIMYPLGVVMKMRHH